MWWQAAQLNHFTIQFINNMLIDLLTFVNGRTDANYTVIRKYYVFAKNFGNLQHWNAISCPEKGEQYLLQWCVGNLSWVAIFHKHPVQSHDCCILDFFIPFCLGLAILSTIVLRAVLRRLSSDQALPSIPTIEEQREFVVGEIKVKARYLRRYMHIYT